MTITIDLTPEVEAQIREEAAKVGMEEGDFILNTLQERVCRPPVPSREFPPRLSSEETRLLLEINKGLPEEMSQEYHNLVANRSGAVNLRRVLYAMNEHPPRSHMEEDE